MHVFEIGMWIPRYLFGNTATITRQQAALASDEETRSRVSKWPTVTWKRFALFTKKKKPAFVTQPDLKGLQGERRTSDGTVCTVMWVIYISF